MSLETAAGKATVGLLCTLFGISRQAYYQAKAAAEGRRPGAKSSNELGEQPAELGPPALVESTSALSGPSGEQGTLRASAGAEIPSTPGAQPMRGGREVTVAELERAIRAIVADHPAWGVRKVWATLRQPKHGLKVSKKRVWALMKAWGLCLPGGSPRNEMPRGHVAVEAPNRLFATDLTTVWTEEDGLAAVVPVVDCGCRSVLGLEVTKSQEAPAILAVVREVLVEEFGTVSGVPDGLELRTDHGPQYTGVDCEDLCRDWAIDHTFAPVGRPTGNAVAERLIRTMKEECIWLRDWKSIAELRVGLEAWKRSYNEERPHQSLSWQTPAERRTQFLAASAEMLAAA